MGFRLGFGDKEKPAPWRDKLATPEKVWERIRPGMGIYLAPGMAEPRTLVNELATSKHPNLHDLEIIQLVSFGQLLAGTSPTQSKFRLRTFCSGWIISQEIAAGRADLVPGRFARIPALIESGRIKVDAAFVQISPFNEQGYASLGVAVDAAQVAMSQAELVVGEINPHTPVTHGDTFVHASKFDYLIESKHEPIFFQPWDTVEVFEKIARNMAEVIPDGACLAFFVGPLYDALGHQLAGKKDLGVHSPIFSDALKNLVELGAVTNRRKRNFLGKSVAAYAVGSKDLIKWLDHNPLVEFQGLDKVFDPWMVRANRRFHVILPARKVDLTGQIALRSGKANMTVGPGEAVDLVVASEMSRGGATIFGLPSRNLEGKSNILLSSEQYPNLFTMREAVNMVATEYGVAELSGKSIRERAQALIDIAHPEDRRDLVEQAKAANILYRDQIFIQETALLYPSELAQSFRLKNNEEVRFRAIKPSDEDEMRRLFYRFSDEAVYYRYFSRIRSMPHEKMQEYVNVDYSRNLSVVGLVGTPGSGHIIAEARYMKHTHTGFADVAFIVDEKYQGQGLATFLLRLLAKVAKSRNIQGFTADVIGSNRAMIKVFEKSGLSVKANLTGGDYKLSIPFFPATADEADHADLD